MTSKYQKKIMLDRAQIVLKRKGERKNFLGVVQLFIFAAPSPRCMCVVPCISSSLPSPFSVKDGLVQRKWLKSFLLLLLQNFFRQIKPNHKSFRLLNSIAKSSTTEEKSFAVKSKFQLAWGEFKIMPAKCKKWLEHALSFRPVAYVLKW